MEIKDLEIIEIESIYQGEDENDQLCIRMSFEVDEKLLIENLIGTMGYAELIALIEKVVEE